MVATETALRLEVVAQHLFDVVTSYSLTAPRGRRRSGDLKELEFLTLSLLQGRSSLIVGDIQRQLGVLPAQMSRIIRALETRERPLIACRINSTDKRKVDVALTPSGVQALEQYQASRIQDIAIVLGKLTDEDHDHLQRMLERLQDLVPGRPRV
jgi:DNA-binding MarR family transcriptional regulator